jgi:TolB-like protein/tetratricopeptide (TPR) repeat protein
MSDPADHAVFLSYASQDAAAAHRICEALRAAGVVVWLDQEGGLVGGDAWDRKIRGQVATCRLFVPLISANTQARKEGYFRLEWHLAEERMRLIAKGVPFILPVSIDGTSERGALVPDAFLAVQWTRIGSADSLAAFCERVRKLLAPENSGVGVSLDDARAPRSPDGRRQATPLQERSRPWLAPALVALPAAIVLGLAASLWLRRPASDSSPPPDLRRDAPATTAPASRPPAPDALSVAVLPFANLSNDPEQEYFSDGLTEEILNALARERDLRVPGRASAFSFKGKNVSSAEIARTLNVARLVEGSVRKQGTRVRIGVTLTRAADGFSEELGTFTEELTDIFALQDKIARTVVEKITRRNTTAGAAVLTKTPEAYDAYLRGRALQTRANTNARAATAHYERAVTLDPAFALAWARLAETRFRPYGGADRSPAVVADARTAIDHALAAQPNLPEGLIMRANWVLWLESDFAAARRDLARAESLQPPTVELRRIQATLARELGDWPEAQRLAREALSLDPQNGDYRVTMAYNFFSVRGEFAEADRLYAQAMSIQGPGESGPFTGRVSLRMRWRGATAALRLVERAPAGQSGVERMRAEMLVALGRLDEARVLVDAIEKSSTKIVPTAASTLSRNQSNRASLELLQAVGYDELARRRAEEIRAVALQEFERGNRAPRVHANLVRAELALGHTAVALAALEDWRRETATLTSGYRRFNEFGGGAAILYALAGRADEALALVREAQAGGIQFTSLLGSAELRLLRADPRFAEVFRQADAWAKAQPDPLDP